MSILDRYITRRFLQTLLFALVAFTVIYLVVDGVENLDDYIDREVPRPVIAMYYAYYVPYVIVLVFPVAMLLSSLLSIGDLARHNELLAIKSSGVSLYRTLAPVLAAGFLLSLVVMYFGERIVPVTNQRKAELKRRYVDRIPQRVPRRVTNIYYQDAPTRRLFIGYYNARTNHARKVSLQETGPDGSKVLRRFDAPEMVWADSVWVMLDGYLRELNDGVVKAVAFDSLAQPELSLRPDQVAKVEKKPEEMSYEELQAFIEEVRRNGGDTERWLVDLYLKISFPFANFIIVLLGVSLASNKRRSGMAMAFGLSLFIIFFYFGFIKLGQTLGHNGTLDPLLSAWLGNLVFFVAGVWILIKARK
jgi:lipopolysaccharide export system permease protein